MINPSPQTINTPDWVKHAVFYQIFPDRFARAAPPEDSNVQRSGKRANYQNHAIARAILQEWGTEPTYEGYMGGNLWGVIDQLDYLQELGITAIYFTPVFQSACNHRYHTHDYYQIAPLLGGNEALQQLLAAAHQRDIKVVLDGVFNHASRGFFFFNDILENGPNSPWLDWFTIEKWPLSAYDGSLPANYLSWVNNRALPKFNHQNPAVREYIMQVAEYWLGQGIDGWRLDVPDCIEVEGFWQEFRDRVKAVNPDAYIVGEIWEDASQWLDGTQFDGVMNYPFAEATIAFVAGERVLLEEVKKTAYKPYPAIDASEYADRLKELLKLHPWPIQLTQLNLFDSHDVPRLFTVAGGEIANKKRKSNHKTAAKTTVELATLLLLTFPGAPSIYYGDEVGLPGAHDPDNRRAFPDASEWDKQVLQYHKELIALRHAHPALRIGEYEVLFAKDMAYVFARSLPGQPEETAIVAVNAGNEAISIQVRAELEHKPSQIVYGKGQANWLGNQTTSAINFDLSARSGLILAD
ncbi:pullulanase, isoamylase [Thalassoporum mexicanum PCC 7367]|uniref:glycoside hydrolase family 13 protein n=1 Tax=Thalassoporum mexicanum TaxID=3457544 RepID=UPI00029FA9FE|nr:glycoside hydrolase family 13 protein [Pseudanabaena sp. PCC 7367]AFY70680.1 pullulanase, isoamylase [Pseudanabaena sp. PCC 7367]